jgi:hypothetical protein
MILSDQINKDTAKATNLFRRAAGHFKRANITMENYLQEIGEPTCKKQKQKG